MNTLLKVLVVTCSWLCRTLVSSAPRQARLSLAEPMPSYYYTNIDGYPGTYSFGYDVSDPSTGNTQFRTEERYPNGTVVGTYGYVDPFGRPRRYRYVADERGYRLMNDKPKNLYEVTYSPVNMEVASTESSITWTRPKKKKTDYISKVGIERRNYVNPLIYISKPPSFYVKRV